jgi:hypothetical protein
MLLNDAVFILLILSSLNVAIRNSWISAIVFIFCLAAFVFSNLKPQNNIDKQIKQIQDNLSALNMKVGLKAVK